MRQSPSFAGQVFPGGILELVRVTLADNENSLRIRGGLECDDSTFVNNRGTALTSSAGSMVQIRRTRFQDNLTHEGWGGAIESSGTLVVQDTVFENNGSPAGGAVAVAAGTTSISRSVFRSNYSWGGGGAVLVASLASAVTVDHVDFVSNRAIGGAALYAAGTSHPSIRNSIFVGHVQTDALLFDSSGAVTYCAFHQNAFMFVTSTLDATNLFVDPRFVDYPDDLSLAADSPLVDAGDPTTFDPDGSRADIGAFWRSNCPGPACIDDDGDGWNDESDNCVAVANADQSDLDGDGAGDACDGDDDGDGVGDASDACPTVADPGQADLDEDGAGDACDADDDGDGVADGADNCAGLPNPLQADADVDGVGDACDPDADGDGACDACDGDGDGVVDRLDNCASVANPGQADLDLDLAGDACDDDDDGDGVTDAVDDCPGIADAEQLDHDSDGAGDACDGDDDGDGAADADDSCPLVANGDQRDWDGDGAGDVCDDDDDGDGVADTADLCPLLANPAQGDDDDDGLGDECDPDRDGDGIPDLLDVCPAAYDPDQADDDGDGTGDACDGDLDGDGVDNAIDNCGFAPNADQADLDGDGDGDACDLDGDGDGVTDMFDVCPRIADPLQTDRDADGLGDACDDDDDGDDVPDTLDNCPLVANPDQANGDDDLGGDACDEDDDGDGVGDPVDACPDTLAGSEVDASGCALDQLCPCAGPRGRDEDWTSHGAYVSCVSRATSTFVDRGLMTHGERAQAVAAAAQSSCGREACQGRRLRNGAANTPTITLRAQSYTPRGPHAPAALRVFAGTTEVAPRPDGSYVIPMRDAHGRVIADSLTPDRVRTLAQLRGAYVVLRRGDGTVVQGLVGHLRSGTASLALTATVSAPALRSSERNLTFDRQGDDRYDLGRAGQDEYWASGSTLELRSTVAGSTDLLLGRVCD